MSIASAITAAQGKVANAYTAVSNKGGTLPAVQNLSNLSTAINSISTGGTISSLTITPTTSQQTITASGGTDGYSPITVNAVTSSIDNNITASNIKSGVSILGVNGSVTELKGETRSVSLTSQSGNTFTPTSGKNGITSITVTPTNQARTVTPTTSQQSLTVGSGYSGNGTITVNAVTSSIDANISAGNIKKDVTILGVTGSYEGSGGSINNQDKTVTENGTYTADEGYTGLGTVTVNVVNNKKKFGLTIDDAINDLTNGTYHPISPLGTVDVSFDGLTGFESSKSGSMENMPYLLTSFRSIRNVSFPDLTTITVGTALEYFGLNSCLRSISFPLLTTISADSALKSAFENSLLTNVSIENLTSITMASVFKRCFASCTSLKTFTAPKLSLINNVGIFAEAFDGDRYIESISFPALTTTSFGSYTNQFTNMMINTGTTTTHTIHFPSNLQSTISGLDGYPTFGGDSSYVVLAFDLTATS